MSNGERESGITLLDQVGDRFLPDVLTGCRISLEIGRRDLHHRRSVFTNPTWPDMFLGCALVVTINADVQNCPNPRSVVPTPSLSDVATETGTIVTYLVVWAGRRTQSDWRLTRWSQGG